MIVKKNAIFIRIFYNFKVFAKFFLTFGTHNYIIPLEPKTRRCIIMGSKIGRPIVGSLKNCEVKIRVDEDMNKKLINFAKANSITRAEAIRKGIQLLLEK